MTAKSNSLSKGKPAGMQCDYNPKNNFAKVRINYHLKLKIIHTVNQFISHKKNKFNPIQVSSIKFNPRQPKKMLCITLHDHDLPSDHFTKKKVTQQQSIYYTRNESLSHSSAL